MRAMARAGTGFKKTLRDVFKDIPKATKVLDINLAYWSTIQWSCFYGRIIMSSCTSKERKLYFDLPT
ncbi:hypothetical protein F5X99DRAFT_386989 [Biscogniauxia marginata]|nr:hypothetical protein F5X99DRAFT_386989 [Biscogniauxia marginata]